MTRPTPANHARLPLRIAALGVLAGVLAAPAPALADKQIRAAPVNRYSTPEVTMDQGERLTFQNLDFNRHNVWATQNGADGKPLFKSATIGNGEEAFVEGSQFLTRGDYGFLCTLHAFMTGTLHVTGNGQPVARPAPGTTPTADSTAPKLSVGLVSARAAAVRRDRELRVTVTVDEAAKVSLKATARVRGRTVTVARGSVRFSSAGTRRRDISLTRAGRQAFRGKRSVKVTLRGTAVDEAGNKASARASRTVRG